MKVLTLLAVLAALVFAACGSDNSSEGDESAQTTTTEEQAENTPEAVATAEAEFAQRSARIAFQQSDARSTARQKVLSFTPTGVGEALAETEITVQSNLYPSMKIQRRMAWDVTFDPETGALGTVARHRTASLGSSGSGGGGASL